MPPTGVTFLSAAGSNGFNCLPPNVDQRSSARATCPGGGDTTITATVHRRRSARRKISSLTATIDPEPRDHRDQRGQQRARPRRRRWPATRARDRPASTSWPRSSSARRIRIPTAADVTMSFIAVNIGDTGDLARSELRRRRTAARASTCAGTHDPAQLVYTDRRDEPGGRCFACTGIGHELGHPVAVLRQPRARAKASPITVNVRRTSTSPTVSANAKVGPAEQAGRVPGSDRTTAPISKTVIKQ